MSRSSPSVARVVAILNFLADHPTRPFSLTDLVRALRISRATCHSVLQGLVEAGYVYRGADKTYSLGGGLARIAGAAAKANTRLQAATSEMRVLADELDVICALLVRDGRQVVVRDRAISRSHIGWNIPVIGTSLPMDPPLGGVFHAWEPEARIEAWLNGASKPLDEEAQKSLRSRLMKVRERGYSFDLRSVSIEGEDHARALVFKTEQSEYMIGEIDPDKAYPLASIQAPVFEPDGTIAFVIALIGFTSGVAGKKIVEIGTRLRGACLRIEAIGG